MTADAEFARQLQEEERQAEAVAAAAAHARPRNPNTTQRPPGPNDTLGVRTIRRLNITVVDATLKSNASFMSKIIKMDPYARVRVGHTMYSTETALGGGSNPIWNNQIIATLPVGVEEIFVEIFDQKMVMEDERLCWGVIELPQNIFNAQETVTKEFDLGNDQSPTGKGKVKLVLSLTEFRENLIIRNGALDRGDLSPAMGNLPPPVQITDEDVQHIVEMFPMIDSDTVREVLVQKGGDKEAAISAFLVMQGS